MNENTICKIFKSKNARLRKLNLKKSFLQKFMGKVDKLMNKVDRQIELIENESRGVGIYFNHVENKHCIVCANRIAERDFKIPEGIVCGHPSNQNGKDRFCHYCHTCEHWKRETKLI